MHQNPACQRQSEALERALEQEAECGAVLQQIAVFRGAVNNLTVAVLEGHLRDHLRAEVESQEERERDLEQVISVIRSY